ncbi:hypothetical protein OAK13_01925 [Candidatus Thioglobus sp.]|nr:hypothetical protein [Candidatus Thioglobus sp.]
MTLAKYNTKNGSPNDRRKKKRALDKEFRELLNMESMMDSDLRSAYHDNLFFLNEQIRGNESL